jgi:hypothetical protein
LSVLIIIYYVTLCFRPPVSSCSEFEIEKIELNEGMSEELPGLCCGSIAIICDGSCNLSYRAETERFDFVSAGGAATGNIYFIASGTSMKVETSVNEKVVIYRAHVNLTPQ